MKADIAKVRKQLNKKPAKTAKPLFLSTGATLLNLACSGRAKGGFKTGCYYRYVGDSSSGKSFIAATTLAEAANNPAFDNYRLVFDDVENGLLMDRSLYFGDKANSRIEPPARDKDNEPKFSSSLDEFYDNVEATIAAGPTIYVLDSMDALDAEEEKAKRKKMRRAKEKGQEVKGSYGTNKARMNSARLREIATQKLAKSGSILIIISQSRMNIGPMAMFNPKTSSGGTALKFYATCEIWTASAKRIYVKRKNGKKEKIGITAQLKIKKNRIQGREPTVYIHILDEHGVDDVGSNVDFLIDEGRWSIEKGVINANDLELQMKREELIEHIQENDLEGKVRVIVSEVWQHIEEECSIKRKRRYE